MTPSITSGRRSARASSRRRPAPVPATRKVRPSRRAVSSRGRAVVEHLPLAEQEHLRAALGLVEVGGAPDHADAAVDQLVDHAARARAARSGRRRRTARRAGASAGVRMSEQARPSFCFMPPESLPASRLVNRSRSVKARSRL